MSKADEIELAYVHIPIFYNAKIKSENKTRYYEENDEILATSNDNYSDGTVIKKFIDNFREILSILKGENQVTVK